MKFDCSMCSGVCCYSPPQLSSMDELRFAIDHGVDLIASKVLDNGYYISIDRREGKCPFLGDDGKCTIYEDRFYVCRWFKCRSYCVDIEHDEGLNFFEGLIVPKEPAEMMALFSEHIVEEHCIQVVDRDEMMQKVNAVSYERFIALSLEVAAKISRRLSKN